MPPRKRQPLLHDLAVVPGHVAARMLDHDSAVLPVSTAFLRIPESAEGEFWNIDPTPPAATERDKPNRKPRKKNR